MKKPIQRRDFLRYSGCWMLGGISVSRDNTVRKEVQQQIQAGLIRGAVWTSAKNDTFFCEGLERKIPSTTKMSPDSRFDLASVTKTFTAAACSLLVVEGELEPDVPFTKYLPEHILGKECDITVRDLAMHVGGFDNSKPYQSPDEKIFHRELFAKLPVRQRLTAYEYSCYNYILLGKMVERITGKRLDIFCKERIFEPLQMFHTCWGPLPNSEHLVQVPWAQKIGAISDETAHFCPFPIGNAGAFSTISDMRRYAADLQGRKHFPQEYYDLQFSCQYEKKGVRRSFGWDMSANLRPEGLSSQTIFHSGFTGQTLWIDPENAFYAVVLTCRTGDWGQALHGRKKIAELLKKQ